MFPLRTTSFDGRFCFAPLSVRSHIGRAKSELSHSEGPDVILDSVGDFCGLQRKTVPLVAFVNFDLFVPFLYLWSVQASISVWLGGAGSLRAEASCSGHPDRSLCHPKV